MDYYPGVESYFKNRVKFCNPFISPKKCKYYPKKGENTFDQNHNKFEFWGMEEEPPFKLIKPRGFCQILDLLVKERQNLREYIAKFKIDDRTAAYSLLRVKLVVFGVPGVETETQIFIGST